MLRRTIFLITTLLAVPGLVLAGASASGVSNKMNPALSVNALCLADYSTESDEAALNGIHLQEAEMQFTSIVDPFWKANVILSAFPNDDDASTFGVNVEEANITSTSLPWGVGLKMGKFFVDFGKHAKLHTHQFPFVEAPVAVASFLGCGLSEMGAELVYSPPLPWYSDLVVYGLNGDTEIFDNRDSRIAVGGHWMNLWDTSDNATLELGGSLLNSAGSLDHFGRKGTVNTYGADLTYKWISSASSHGPALTLMAEYLLPSLEETCGDPQGWYAMAQYRWHHQWWLGVEYGQVDCGDGAGPGYEDSIFNGETREYKFNATFTPSEFSALRLEAAWSDDLDSDEDNLQISLQWNFTIGSHPAHLY